MKLSKIVEATGMSKAYASDVRRGKWTPHVSTWRALAGLVRIALTRPTSSSRGGIAPK